MEPGGIDVIFQISSRALARTTKCPSDFACLTCENHCLCPVERVAGEGTLVLRNTSPEACPYEGSSGSDSTCKCPTRFEIYERYGK